MKIGFQSKPLPGLWTRGLPHSGLPTVWLTPEQVQKIGSLLNDPEGRNQALMQQRWEAQVGLTRLYATEKRDWSAIRSASLTVFNLQRQQLDATFDLQQKIDALLADSQWREVARAQRSHGWMGVQ